MNIYPSESTKQLLNTSIGGLNEIKGYEKLDQFFEGTQTLREFPLRFILTVWGESLEYLIQNRSAVDLNHVLASVTDFFTNQALENNNSAQSQVSFSHSEVNAVSQFMDSYIQNFEPSYKQLGALLADSAHRSAAIPSPIDDYQPHELDLDDVGNSYVRSEARLKQEIEAKKRAFQQAVPSSDMSATKYNRGLNTSHKEYAEMSESRINFISPSQHKGMLGKQHSQSDIIKGSHETSMQLSSKKNPLELTFLKTLGDDVRQLTTTLVKFLEAPRNLLENGSQPRLAPTTSKAYQETTPMRDAKTGSSNQKLVVGLSDIKHADPNVYEQEDSIMIQMKALHSPRKEQGTIVRNFEDIKDKVAQLEEVITTICKTTTHAALRLEQALNKQPGLNQGDQFISTITEAFAAMQKYFETVPSLEAQKLELLSESARKSPEPELELRQASIKALEKIQAQIEQIEMKNEKEDRKNPILHIQLSSIYNLVLDMKRFTFLSHTSAICLAKACLNNYNCHPEHPMNTFLASYLKQLEDKIEKTEREYSKVANQEMSLSQNMRGFFEFMSKHEAELEKISYELKAKAMEFAHIIKYSRGCDGI